MLDQQEKREASIFSIFSGYYGGLVVEEQQKYKNRLRKKLKVLVNQALSDYKSKLSQKLQERKKNCECYDENYCCEHGYDNAINDVISLINNT